MECSLVDEKRLNLVCDVFECVCAYFDNETFDAVLVSIKSPWLSSVVAELLRAPGLGSDVSDQQSVGSSPGCAICVYHN